MVARQDPDRYAAQLLREKRKAGKAGAIMRHQQNLESYREKRLHLAAVSGKKPDPYDEFTVFGQPSGPVTAGQAGRQSQGVWACMRFDDAMPKPAPATSTSLRPEPEGPKSQLKKELDALATELRGVFPYPHGHDRRPLSSHKRQSAPSARPSDSAPAPPAVRFGGGSRRPLTSISAYQKAGINPKSAALLTTGASAAIEQWRTGSKFEEQMLLGQLKNAMPAIGAAGPLWKLERYERIPGRL